MPDAWPGDRFRAADQRGRGNRDRLHRGADHEQRAVRAQTPEHRRHGVGARDRGQDQVDPAERQQRLARVARGAVDVVVGAELARQRLLLGPASHGHGLEAELDGELHAEVTEAADPEHGHPVTAPRAAAPQRVERRDAGTQQRGGFLGREAVGHRGQTGGAHEHVVRVAPVGRDAGNLHVLAVDQRSSPTLLAVAAIAAEPPNADALPDLPALDPVPERGDLAGDLVAGDERVADPRIAALLGEHVAVAHAAGVHAHERLAGARRRHLALPPTRSRPRAGSPVLHASCLACLNPSWSMSSGVDTRCPLTSDCHAGASGCPPTGAAGLGPGCVAPAVLPGTPRLCPPGQRPCNRRTLPCPRCPPPRLRSWPSAVVGSPWSGGTPCSMTTFSR